MALTLEKILEALLKAVRRRKQKPRGIRDKSPTEDEQKKEERKEETINWVYQKILDLTQIVLDQLLIFVNKAIMRVLGDSQDPEECLSHDGNVQKTALDALLEFLRRNLGLQMALN
ncbi:uncharacterized protein LOC108031284 [Drosophila biarmipes]|uniref:uncharacterized protein LOC108031284 n=1 Tax=Drosophila biarmipes TaxID=125945 RepID=UPI0007E637D2|nr:uncharacterized protein LOC108031284 [Drosophila biarmipes]